MSAWVNIQWKRYEFDNSFTTDSGAVYKFSRFIASGGNSIIYEVMDEREEKTYALKFLKFLNQKDDFNKEIELMREFSAPGYIDNFITLYATGNLVGYQTTKGRKKTRTGETINIPFFLMDRADDQTIKDYLCQEKLSEKEEQEIFPYIQKLAESLKMIHEKNYVHRDIKPKNILMHGTIPKIADFGLMVQENTCLDKKAPKFWPTPEYISLCDDTEHCSHMETDIFQLGCIFYFLYTGKYPIGIVNINEINGYKMEKVIKKMLSYSKNDRYRNGSELYSDIMEQLK